MGRLDDAKRSVGRPRDIRLEHPVHALPVESHAQRIQRLVWASSRKEPI
jgi:hypothetical protein